MPYANESGLKMDGWEAPEDPCDEGKGVYLPKNAWTGLVTEVCYNDSLQAGLEFIMHESGLVSPDITNAMKLMRCAQYQIIGAYLVQVPWLGKDGKLW